MLSRDWSHKSTQSIDEFVREVREGNKGKVIINTLAFDPYDYPEFSRRISAENNGISRRIFTNFDAAASVSFNND